MRFVKGVLDLCHCTIYDSHYGEYFLLICRQIIYTIVWNCICELFLYNYKICITESWKQFIESFNSSSTHIYSIFPDF